MQRERSPRSHLGAFGAVGVLALTFGCNALLGTDEGDEPPPGGEDDAATSTDPTRDGSSAPPGASDGGLESGAPGNADGSNNDGTGPGPLGALPFGYCCTKAEECRSRRCEAVGSGGKVCLDRCSTNDACTRTETTFVCTESTPPEQEKWCRPSSASFTCIPASQFVHGTKKTGECCTPMFDGRNGLECQGGYCGALNDSPYMCNQWCNRTADCPGGWFCSESICIPDPIPTVCK